MRRIYGFDYIRGISAVLIMLFHYTAQYYDVYYNAGFVEGHRGVWWGCYCVSAFFMLSAYLTVSNLDNEKKAGRFILKRAIRLYPAYWIAILLSTAFTLLLEREKFIGVLPTLINFTMLQGFIKVPVVDSVYWTLRYELEFYLIIAVIIKLHLKNKMNLLNSIWLAAIIGSELLSRLIGKNIINSVLTVVLMSAHAHEFILGASLALIVKNRKSVHSYVNAAIALCLNGYNYRTAFIIIIAVLMIVFAISEYRFKYDKPLLWLAQISYPLYLIHYRIGYSIMRKSEAMNIGLTYSVIFCIILSIVIAVLMHRFVELPSARLLKNKLLK